MKNQKTKLCEHCQSEIPKKANVCPVCRKRQTNKLAVALITIGALGLIGAVAGSSSNTPKQVETSDAYATATEKEETKTRFAIGETAELNGVQVTLLSIEESNGTSFLAPDSGNIYVIAEMEIVNNSGKDLTISSLLSFELYADDYAQNVSLGAISVHQEQQFDGIIADGKKKIGIIGYEIPADWQEVEIHFTDNVWSNHDFTFVYEK